MNVYVKKMGLPWFLIVVILSASEESPLVRVVVEAAELSPLS